MAENGPFDFKDIDAAHKLHGKGPHLVEIDWEPMSERQIRYRNNDRVVRKKWQWKHKLTGHITTWFLHGKTWDSSKLYHYGSVLLKREAYPCAYDRY